jgi:L-ribulose-5-phosphate 3-epimerase
MNMKLGTMVAMDMERLEEEFADLREMGFETCQLNCWQEASFTRENAATVKALMKKYGVEVSAFWCGWAGPCEWNFAYGPTTIGLVPAAYRHRRLETLEKGSDFSAELGIEDIVTHVGFIPNNPSDPDYAGLVGAIRRLCMRCGGNGQYFLFETGQEAPVVLLRTIEDVGAGNLGINLDPANLLMYGLGNPIDALDVFGSYVRNVHGKDGVCPSSGRVLGEEMPIGQGKVNYPELIKKLKGTGYDRYITIEREISGEEQKTDIRAAKLYLEQLWAND